MQIKIKATNLDLTPAIQTFINDKIGSLERFLKPMEVNDILLARVEISRTTKHHNKGPVYRAEANIKLAGKLLRAEYEDWNVRRAIDEVKDELRREIKKYASKFRPQDSRRIKQLRELRGK